MSQMFDNSQPEKNGLSETAKVQSLVRSLQAECEQLRAALANVQHERDLYLKAVYELTRPTFAEFANVDIDELKKTSAGLVEPIDLTTG